ncbi:unnamed protein product [Spirodela intermedia]|uniref:RRM domain-containing protein n=1 Tax=Spirodela intermedia TaxID=51605 RepID=A0A7I8LJ02_SPIIN|nr:unnamed protein product [Spirodela intermedia]
MGEQEATDDAAAAALIASSSSRSFRMNRRSPEGKRLKAAVSRKLVDFLANYTDDVLAEYIVVLVCNGMNLSTPPNQNSGSFDKSKQLKPKLLRNPEHAAAGDNPMEDEVLDVMKRLCQIEREMLEIRSKQTKMNADAKVLASQGPSLRSFLEEDVDARTVFVANVHFSAPKEVLSSHFAQCGPIVRLITPVNTVAAQQQGSAYITFTNRESVDKALSLNGTTFFSRTLKVTRKSDERVGTIAPKQAAGKLQNLVVGRTRQPFNSEFLGKDLSQKHFCGHLQWKRDQTPGGDNPTSVTATLPSHVTAKGLSQRNLSSRLQWRREKAAAGGDESASHAEQ